jgi:hypothetical protein
MISINELIMKEKKATPANIMQIPTTFSRFVIGNKSPYPTVDRGVMLK